MGRVTSSKNNDIIFGNEILSENNDLNFFGSSVNSQNIETNNEYNLWTLYMIETQWIQMFGNLINSKISETDFGKLNKHAKQWI